MLKEALNKAYPELEVVQDMLKKDYPELEETQDIECR